MATITETDRIRRALKIMKEYRDGRRKLLDALEGINIKQVRSMRNYEYLTLADVEQKIRQAEAELEYARIHEAMDKHPRIMTGGYAE